LEIEVTWFRAPIGALAFPGHCLLASGNWASAKYPWNGVGEVEGAPRPWRDGKGPFLFSGQYFAGPITAFTEGTEYPGIPVGCQEDGQCAACATVIPNLCSDQVQTFGPGFYLKITQVYDAPPTPWGHVGDRFFFLFVGPGFPFYDHWWNTVVPPPFTNSVLGRIQCNGASPPALEMLVSVPGDLFEGHYLITLTGWGPTLGFTLSKVDIPNRILEPQGGSGEKWDLAFDGFV